MSVREIMPFTDQVALGLQPGFVDIRRWNENPVVSETQEEMSNIASGVRTLPSSASVVTIASSSAEDGAGTTTGVNSVIVKYLDANWIERQETVALNGTGNVTTTGTAIRFVAAIAATVGSTGAAVGNISFTIDGNVQSRILIGQAETRETGTSCPDNKYILLRSFEIAVGRSASVDVDISIEIRDADTQVWYTVTSLQVYQSVADLGDREILLGPRDDFRILASASGASAPPLSITVHGWQINKETVRSLGSVFPALGHPSQAD